MRKIILIKMAEKYKKYMVVFTFIIAQELDKPNLKESIEKDIEGFLDDPKVETLKLIGDEMR